MAKPAKAKTSNRSALRGRTPTEAVPSVEEFLGRPRDTRAAFKAGHIGELRDVIQQADINADLLAERRAHTSQRIMLPDGTIDARVQPSDPIALPAWAFRIVCDTALGALEDGHVERRKGKRHWWRRYRDSLIHWHRYVLVQSAVDEGYTQSPNKEGNPTAGEIVSAKLTGTSFGALAKTMQASFEKVRGAVELGEEWRYYRSRSDSIYQQLLDPGGPVVIQVAGIHVIEAGSAPLAVGGPVVIQVPGIHGAWGRARLREIDDANARLHPRSARS